MGLSVEEFRCWGEVMVADVTFLLTAASEPGLVEECRSRVNEIAGSPTRTAQALFTMTQVASAALQHGFAPDELPLAVREIRARLEAQVAEAVAVFEADR